MGSAAGGEQYHSRSAGSGVTVYWLSIGSSVGGEQYYSHTQGTALTGMVSNLPRDD